MCMQPSIGILSSSDEVMTPGRVRTDLLWKKKNRTARKLASAHLLEWQSPQREHKIAMYVVLSL